MGNISFQQSLVKDQFWTVVAARRKTEELPRSTKQLDWTQKDYELLWARKSVPKWTDEPGQMEAIYKLMEARFAVGDIDGSAWRKGVVKQQSLEKPSQSTRFCDYIFIARSKLEHRRKNV